jgi:error-prone DNA polymerase
MLTCLRKGFDLICHHYGRKLQLGMIPHDENVFGMISRADTIGVFQIESRAQMSMLPRLQPKKFYDLVIEVAIVRPGPIQGDMVHPYLRRREGKEPVSYPSQELHDVLERTLGVPLFQEQAMKIAIVGAGFTPGEADRLRRAMATFKHDGNVSVFRDRFINGMVERNYDRDFAERCFSQIEGFGTYGFPESHAASFALLVYDSAWMKYHYPEVFACALLNSQPMGFYQPAQIVRCARDHGVEVRPVDVNRSDYDCTLEPSEGKRLALRLGLRQVKGLGKKEADRIAAARGTGYANPAVLQWRTGLGNAVLAILAEADAFGSMGLERRQALWAVKRLDGPPLPLFAAAETKDAEPRVLMPAAYIGEEVSVDYDLLSLSLKQHPLALLRDQLEREGITTNRILAGLRSGTRVRVSGLVLIRQQPGTASGVIFMTLEDETGIANIVVWNRMFQRYRRIVLGAGLVEVHGTIQNESNVVHVVAERFVDLTGRLRALRSPPLGQRQGRADAVTHPAYERSALPIKSRDFH